MPTDQSIATRAEMPSRSTGWLILLDTCLIASLTVLVKIAGAAKSVIAARFFGTGNALDCYWAAFLIPSFLADVLAGAINPTLVPKLIEAAECDGENAFQNVYASAFYGGILLLGAVSLSVLAAADVLLRLSGAGFSVEKISLAHQLMLVLLPIMPLNAMAAVWRSVLNAGGRFMAAAISPVLTPLVLIACVISLAKQYGVIALGIGTTAGCVAEVLFLAMAVACAGVRILPRWNLRPASPRLWQQYASIVINNLALGGSGVVNQAMAASLGPGSVSTFVLANRGTGLLLTIGPSALLIAGLPRLAKMVARHDWPGLQRTVCQMLLVSIAVASFFTVGLCLFSKPIVKFFFQGNNFTAADTLAVAHLQALLVLQLPFAVGSAVLARALVVLQLKKMLIYVSAASVLLGLMLNQLFMRSYGLSGIAIASVVGQALILLILSCLLSGYRRRFVEPSSLRISAETFSEL